MANTERWVNKHPEDTEYSTMESAALNKINDERYPVEHLETVRIISVEESAEFERLKKAEHKIKLAISDEGGRYWRDNIHGLRQALKILKGE